MNIPVIEKNYDKIKEELDKVQKRTTARNISLQTILNDIEVIERKLRISKKNMVGIIVGVDHNAQDFPRAYKYVPESTQYALERKTSTWNITNICRDKTGTIPFHMYLTDDAKKAIIKTYEYFTV